MDVCGSRAHAEPRTVGMDRYYVHLYCCIFFLIQKAIAKG